MKKLSPLWVIAPHGRCLHRKREYGPSSKTLCGRHVTRLWSKATIRWLKCKRCAA